VLQARARVSCSEYGRCSTAELAKRLRSHSVTCSIGHCNANFGSVGVLASMSAGLELEDGEIEEGEIPDEVNPLQVRLSPASCLALL
jgi:hypothetical protein